MLDLVRIQIKILSWQVVLSYHGCIGQIIFILHDNGGFFSWDFNLVILIYINNCNTLVLLFYNLLCVKLKDYVTLKNKFT